MKLFVHHGADGITAVDNLNPDDTVAALLSAGDVVWALDSEDPIDSTTKVSELIASGREEIVVSHCKKVAVTVTYNGITAVVNVSPARKIRAVISKAIKEPSLGIDPATAADLELRFPGSEEALDVSMPIARLLEPGKCALKLILIPAIRHAG